jgi:L-fucose isomerase-like protein
MDATAVAGTGGVYAALRSTADEHRLDGLAVRCWPEFFTELGCAACGAMSMLGNEMCPASCEADVNGTLTLVLLQALSQEPAFIADLVSIETGSDTGVLWHCGLAPASMADPQSGIAATVHSNRKLPLLFEFALKPGRVTLARLHRSADAQASHPYQLVIGGGEMVRAPASFGGTSGVIRFDRSAAEVLDTIMRHGLEHHVCLTYGDYRAELRMAAHRLDLPVLELC